MKTPLMLVLLMMCLLAASAALAQQHNYWPIAVGNSHWYVGEENADLTCHMHVDGMVVDMSHFEFEVFVDGELDQYVANTTTTNQEGDVFFHHIGYGGAVWYTITPPYVMIDAPLFVGKVWDFETFCSPLGNGVHHAEVVSEGWVSVPAGTFYCFEVFYDETYENIGHVWETWWLCDGVGAVKFTRWGYASPFVLESCAVIGNEQQSWSEVKSLYR